MHLPTYPGVPHAVIKSALPPKILLSPKSAILISASGSSEA